jgi:hypothetical protein
MEATAIAEDEIRRSPPCRSEPMPRKSTPPNFKNEAQERIFWENHDSSAHLDWTKAKRGRFPNLKPSDSAEGLSGEPISRLVRRQQRG